MPAVETTIPRLLTPGVTVAGCVVVMRNAGLILKCRCGERFWATEERAERADRWGQSLLCQDCQVVPKSVMVCRRGGRHSAGGPTSDKAARAVELMTRGYDANRAAKAVGVARSTADNWYLRWVELPALRARVKELESLHTEGK